MTKKKTRTFHSKISTIICIVIALLLMAFGAGTLFYLYMKDQKGVSDSDKQTEKVEQVIKNVTPEQEDPIPDDCVGIMYIPSFDMKHAIHMGVSDPILNQYIGMFDSYGTVGEPGNAVFASHSTRLGPGKHDRCWFNWIDETVKKGDEIQILWKDGKTYKYKVADVISWVPKSEEENYLSKTPENDGEMITLQTCTHGNANYRSFIYADRVQ